MPLQLRTNNVAEKRSLLAVRVRSKGCSVVDCRVKVFFAGNKKTCERGCRNCGRSFCRKHSRQSIPLFEREVYHPTRVCDDCYAEVWCSLTEMEQLQVMQLSKKDGLSEMETETMDEKRDVVNTNADPPPPPPPGGGMLPPPPPTTSGMPPPPPPPGNADADQLPPLPMTAVPDLPLMPSDLSEDEFSSDYDNLGQAPAPPPSSNHDRALTSAPGFKPNGAKDNKRANTFAGLAKIKTELLYEAPSTEKLQVKVTLKLWKNELMKEREKTRFGKMWLRKHKRLKTTDMTPSEILSMKLAARGFAEGLSNQRKDIQNDQNYTKRKNMETNIDTSDAMFELLSVFPEMEQVAAHAKFKSKASNSRDTIWFECVPATKTAAIYKLVEDKTWRQISVMQEKQNKMDMILEGRMKTMEVIIYYRPQEGTDKELPRLEENKEEVPLPTVDEGPEIITPEQKKAEERAKRANRMRAKTGNQGDLEDISLQLSSGHDMEADRKLVLSQKLDKIVKEGYLLKKSKKLLAGWQKRYFALDSLKGKLYYYKSHSNEDRKKLLGELDIHGMEIEDAAKLAEGGKHGASRFNLKTWMDNRTYQLRALNIMDSDEWVAVLDQVHGILQQMDDNGGM